MTSSTAATRYHRPPDAAAALALLHEQSGAVAMSGGTDLLPGLRDGIFHAEHVVDLRGAPEWNGVREAEGGVIVGAATTLETIARHPLLAREYPALTQACAAVGSPALRAMGTLGGNLAQRPRCTWFRHHFPCRKHGGDTCFAVDGPNEHHAILGGGPCHIVHPSDPAVALLALDARLHLRSAAGARVVPAAEFFVLPSVRLDGETCLARGEVVAGVELPAVAAGGRQRYDKLMQRGAWDFALASLAALRRGDGSVRLVLGGVAPVPWRVTTSVEEDVSSGALSAVDIDTLAERALYDARPLSRNAYKVELARTLLSRAITWLNAPA